MNLRGVCVCVGFSDLLERGLDRWHTGLERLIIVTSKADKQTQTLCEKLNVRTHITDIFYANGAKFNKGAALSECFHACGLRRSADWLMTFDADIVPPEDWRVWLDKCSIRPGSIYGSYRYWVPETARGPQLSVDTRRRMPQGWVIGFFMVFHASDPALPKVTEPLFDTCWPHAGNYDTTFCRRWTKDRQIILPIPMIHLGEERANWMGRERESKIELLSVLKRRKGHEDWERERMANPPKIEGL